MRWLKNVARSSIAALLLVAGILGLDLVLVPEVVSAVSTDIGVTVCGEVLPPEVSISQPVNDSVLNQPTVTVRGSVANASQVELFIDGQYGSTTSIGPSESAFGFDISVPVGTHTLKVAAIPLCGGQNATDSIVITYTPAVEQPTNGGATPTTLDGTTSLDGTPVDVTEIAREDVAQPLADMPVIGPVISTARDFATAIGLEHTLNAGGAATPIVGAARVGVTVVAITAVVMAGSLAPVAAQTIPGVAGFFSVKSHRSMTYLGWIIRGAGVLALALAYFI